MALFLNDEHIRCPKCGSEMLYTRDVGTFEFSPKDKTTLICTADKTELVCSKCENVIRSFDKYTQILRG